MTYRRCNAFAAAFFTLCLCVVLSRNVENTRAKRGTAGDETDCENVRPFFKMWNISTEPPRDGSKGSLCSGDCCGPDIEIALRKQGQRDFAILLRHNSRTLQGLLTTMENTLQNHVTELAKQSENNTLILSAQVYKGMFPSTQDPISALYSDIRRYVQLNGSRDAFLAPNIDIKSTVTHFFVALFPVAHQHAIDASMTRDFTAEYQECVKNTFNEAQPFGDIPRQVAQSLSKSLESTMLLLQALEIGIEVLNATDTLIIEDNGRGGNAECHDALMKMTYCPKCLGLKGAAKPCSGYCLNVLRGCLSKYVSELDSPWNGYVEGIERLVTAMKQPNNEAGVNPDLIIRGLETKISEAIMYAIAKRNDTDSRVKRSCGPAKYAEDVSTTTSSPEIALLGGGKQRRAFAPMPVSAFGKFLTSIARSKNFYGNLADSLCEDDNFAERKDQHCWNGERIGEYTMTVVDASLDTQKYNPEVKLNTDMQNVDPRVAQLADKLRHVHQMVISSLGAVSLPEVDNYMQGDGADGSGSGNGPDFEDDGSTGSGSGDGNPITEEPINPRKYDVNFEGKKPSVTVDKPTGSGSIDRTSSTILLSVTIIIITRYFFLA